MSVVAAGKFHEPIPPRSRPGEPHRRHRGLGAGGDKTHHVDQLHRFDDPLGENHLELNGVAVRDAPLELGSDGRHHRRRLVAEDVRSVGEHVVDEVIAVRASTTCAPFPATTCGGTPGTAR